MKIAYYIQFYIRLPRLPPNNLIPILLISALIPIKDQYRYSLTGLISIHTFSPRGLHNLRYGSRVVMKFWAIGGLLWGFKIPVSL